MKNLRSDRYFKLVKLPISVQILPVKRLYSVKWRKHKKSFLCVRICKKYIPKLNVSKCFIWYISEGMVPVNWFLCCHCVPPKGKKFRHIWICHVFQYKIWAYKNPTHLPRTSSFKLDESNSDGIGPSKLFRTEYTEKISNMKTLNPICSMH